MTNRKARFHRINLVLLRLTLVALSNIAGALSSQADVLDEPARISERAGSLIQLCVTKAGDRLVSVGERGVVMLSDDQGKSWHQGKTPVSVSLTRAYFVDAKQGWAIGHSGVVLVTHDGGETWSKQLDGIKAAQLELDAAKLDAASGIKVGNRIGEAERLVADGADKPLLDLHFFDSRRGIIVGAYGLAFATDDGGLNWHSVMGRLQAANGRHLYAILASGKKIFLVGEHGTLLSSSDNGLSFSKYELSGKGTLVGIVSGLSDNILLVFGLKGIAYRSSDAGKNWQKVAMPPISLAAGLRLKEGALVLADESGQLYRSDDEGMHFKLLPTYRPIPIAAFTETADGTLVGASVRGAMRLPLKQTKEGDRP